MKLCAFLLLIWFTSVLDNSYGQEASGEYIVKDSVYSQGKVLPLSKGRIQFQKSPKETPVIYNALEIKEYSYDKKVFESLIINGNQKFLKRIVFGKVKL